MRKHYNKHNITYRTSLVKGENVGHFAAAGRWVILAEDGRVRGTDRSSGFFCYQVRGQRGSSRLGVISQIVDKAIDRSSAANEVESGHAPRCCGKSGPRGGNLKSCKCERPQGLMTRAASVICHED